jgi:hypothetical protein
MALRREETTMATITATNTGGVRNAVAGIGAGAVALATGGALLTTGEQQFTWPEIGVAFAIGATVALVTRLALVPWAERDPARLPAWSLGLAIGALASTVLFWWTGAPIALGGAAVLLGRRTSGRQASVGTVVGGVVAVINVAVLVGSIAAQFAPALPQ